MQVINSQDSMHDRATVRGIKRGKKNKKRRPSQSTIRRAGRTAASMIGKIAAFTGVGVAIVLGGAAAWDWATTSASFAIEKIDIRGNKRATKDSIVRLAGVAEGQNLLSIDVAAIERTIDAHPWVERVSVSRRFPKRVEIAISEHEPAVLVSLGHLYYADTTGEIVKRYTPGENESIPVVTGLTREEIETDDGDAKARLVSAIDFLAELKTTMGEAAPSIAEVHLDRAIGLSFIAKNDDARVVIGAPPWRTSIERYVKVRAALAEKGVRASRIVIGGERRPDRAVARLSHEGAQEQKLVSLE
jgi:cell division protein FtsQ